MVNADVAPPLKHLFAAGPARYGADRRRAETRIRENRAATVQILR